ncbi:Ser/Thr protein phosphatase family protein [Plasmodium gonderi]|uniref:Ser/Thr protein phosphatase family protein n=1 Tax=Plasmodium gonderi TaxID=77519 RepID=A0A1Y1JIW0_PLAGO|nr:Ser/Thr protein phosphatase family protein [Plasmodium gonderi]GAW82439.1 Ser/Thr protein phosphatase family protein [Plasmodium gonderi]
MNITKYVLIILSFILLKYISRKALISYENVLLNNILKGPVLGRIIKEDNERNAKSEKDKEEEREYEEYLRNKGSNEFEKVKYKYMDYVNFTIHKSTKTCKHLLNEFLVFLGSQYSTEEKLVFHVKLIDILSLLFVHYKDNLSSFDHAINSFQDRNKLMNSIENEYFREFIDERDNYIFEVKNLYYNINNKDEEKEKVLNKKKQIYEIFLQNWKNDGYRFYSVNNKKKAYIPKKIDHKKKKKNENHIILQCRNLVSSPQGLVDSTTTPDGGKVLKEEVNSNEKQNDDYNSKMLSHVEEDVQEETRQEVEERTEHVNKLHTITEQKQSLEKNVNDEMSPNEKKKHGNSAQSRSHVQDDVEEETLEEVGERTEDVNEFSTITEQKESQEDNSNDESIKSMEFYNQESFEDGSSNYESLLESYNNQICHSPQNQQGRFFQNKTYRNGIPGVTYKMRKDFFLSGNSFNVISLINAITSNHDNAVVTKLHEGLKRLGITTFDHLVRYTNIIGIFFSYDIFDELYLQIKLVKEYLGLIKKKENEFSIVEKIEKKKKKKKIYGAYKMNDDEIFVPPNCLSAYCKLKSVWMRNRNTTVKIERSNSNGMNFMMLGDIGQGFEEEKDFDAQNMLNLMGFNELKSTVQTMKEWHFKNNADFIINLGDNIPNDGAMNYLENFEWHNLMKELFVFKKRSEEEINNVLGHNPITKQSITEFYNERMKELKDDYNNRQAEEKKKKKNKKKLTMENDKKGKGKKENDTETFNNETDFSDYDHDRKKLYQFDEEKESDENFEAIPFYSILGEKDYFFFPSEQIQEHYSNRIPGYFMPNNYYCVNYDFIYKNVGYKEIINEEKFRASFIFIDTWSLMVGFPIIRNYRSFREQFNWLSKTLYESAQKSDWIFVIGHHPLISSGRRADNYSYEEHSFHDILRDFLFNYNVDGYFSSHDHLMEYIKFGNIDLFINGSSSRVLFDNSNMGRGYFGKVIGNLYPVTCYILKTIHRGLKPKGCNVNRYSKWSNKSDIGFSVHKLTKDEFITEFINGRNGKPLSHKIVLKNKKHERKKFYDLDAYADDRIGELEKKIKEFALKNPDLIKYKVEEFNENVTKLNLIMKTLKKKEERENFNELLYLNNLIFDVSQHLSKMSSKKLRGMQVLAEKYNIFFNRELNNHITMALEKAVQLENSKLCDQSEQIDEEEAERRLKIKEEKLNEEKKSLELIESLGYNPEQFLEKYDNMTLEEKDLLQEKVGKDVNLPEYINRIRISVAKKNMSESELEALQEKVDSEERGYTEGGKEEQEEICEVSDQENGEEDRDEEIDEIPLVKDVNKTYQNLAFKEKELSEQNYILLMLSSLRIYDETKYSINMDTKKEVIKSIASSNFLYNIEKHKTFFQLCIELAPDIKRIISNFGGVGCRLPFFNLMNKLYDEIMKLKDGLDRIAK